MNEAEVKTKLRPFILNELLQNPDYALGEDEPLITGGLIDSYALAQLGVFAETAFGVYIPDNDLTVENANTFNQMVACILHAAH